MASLLALIVVASSSRGHSVVFSFPPAPQPVKRTSKPTYPTFRQTPTDADHAGHASDADSDAANDSDDDPDVRDEPVSESEGDAALDRDRDELSPAAERRQVESYLGFSSTVLADLLCPNRELCDQPFELVVDHLAFVGHPVWLGDDEPLRRPDARDDDDDDDDEEERGRSRRRRGQAAAGGVDVEPPEVTSAPSRDATVVPHRPLPTPTTAPTSPTTAREALGTSAASSQQSHTSIHGEGRITSFNFVCVIDTPPDSHLSSHLEGYYKDCVVPITANLKALEKREKWLGKEAARLRKAREAFADKGQSAADYFASLPNLSSLAAAISQLFTALKQSQTANITFNSLPVQVLLRGELPIEEEDSLGPEDERDDLRDDEAVVRPPPAAAGEHPGTRAPSVDRARSVSPVEEFQRQRPPLFSRMRRRPPVRFHPWETLLLFEHPEDLQRDVSQGSLIWRYLEICDPTLSFAEYEALLDLDSEKGSMKGIVEHFVHWKKGRVSDVLSLKSHYALSASFNPASLATLSSTFSAAFPLLPSLPVLLSRLSPTETFSTVVTMPSLRATFIEALAWLLRQDLIEKQHSYVRIIIGEDVKRGAAMHWGGESASSASGAEGSGPVRPPMRSRKDSDEPVFGSATGSGGGGSGSGSGVRIRGGRPDLDDARAMMIVGSALSHSPPVVLSRSAQSARSARRRMLNAGRGRPLSGETFSSVSERAEAVGSGPSIVLEPGRPTAQESKWLGEICREKDKSVVDKFDKMVRMLNGGYHLDEIRYRANLSRKDVKTVLSAFADHLVVFTHPRA